MEHEIPASSGLQDFLNEYRQKHANESNRALHMLGTTAAIGLVAAALVKRKPSLLLAASVALYGPALIGDFLFGKNKDATFGRPLSSFRSDLKLWWGWISGRNRSQAALAVEDVRTLERQQPADALQQFEIGT